MNPVAAHIGRRVPAHFRPELGVYLLIVVGWAVGFFAGSFYHAPRVIRSHSVTRLTVEQQLGKPDGTVPGAQVNQALTGLTCFVWKSKAVVICHR